MLISKRNHDIWHGIRINQMVSSVFILITRIVFCSTNVMSVAALPLGQAAGPSSEWICDRQSHPSHGHVDLAYDLPPPGNCAKCRPGN